MSSPSTGPYKSRFLNFLNRQVLHVSDRVEKSVRQIKVAAEWGAQILLYPVYLFVQTGRVARHQLHQSVGRGKLPPSSSNKPQQPPTDRPIQQVLAVVNSQEDGETGRQGDRETSRIRSSSSSPHPTPYTPHPIQGIASLLEQRRLVLVTPDNQILDILTQEQQRQLRQRIIWEVADYWYYHRVRSAKNAGRLPTFSRNHRVLAPVRWFWRTMSWIQASPVALSLNLFGELSVVRFVTASQDPVPRTQYPPTEIIASKLPLVRVEKAQTQRWFGSRLTNFTTSVKPHHIGSLIKAAVDYFFGDRKQALNHDRQTATVRQTPSEAVAQLPGDKSSAIATPHKRRLFIQNWFDAATKLVPIADPLGDRLRRLRGKSFDSLEETQPNPFQIGVLIRAAIDYYFGHQSSPSLAGDRFDSLSGSQPKSQLPTQQASEDFWLSWDDLFETPQINQASAKQGGSRVTQLEPVLPKPGNSLGRIRRYLRLPSQKTDSLTVSPTSAQGDSCKHRPAKPNPSDPSASPATSIAHHSNPSLELDPDWIEADATTVGYVKHPLEKILSWLDQTLLWLEELIARLWRWLFKKAPKPD